MTGRKGSPKSGRRERDKAECPSSSRPTQPARGTGKVTMPTRQRRLPPATLPAIAAAVLSRTPGSSGRYPPIPNSWARSYTVSNSFLLACPSANRSATSTACRDTGSLSNSQVTRQQALAKRRSFRLPALVRVTFVPQAPHHRERIPLRVQPFLLSHRAVLPSRPPRGLRE